MNNVFIDSDIILDLLLQRDPYYASAADLFSSIERSEITAYTSAVVITNIYYISAKLSNKVIALGNVKKLLSLLKIAPIDEKIILLSVESAFVDFEDAIQYFTAKNLGISYFITRNKSDYKVTDITICTAEEYMKVYYNHSK